MLLRILLNGINVTIKRMKAIKRDVFAINAILVAKIFRYRLFQSKLSFVFVLLEGIIWRVTWRLVLIGQKTNRGMCILGKIPESGTTEPHLSLF